MAAEFQPINPAETLRGKIINAEIERANGITADVKQAVILAGFNLQRLKPNEFQVLRALRQDSDQPLNDSNTGTPSVASFGLPVFTNLVFEEDSFETLDGEIIGFEELRIDSVLMSVSMQKTIIKTAIQGKSGTVKEYASDGDFEIDVKGVLVGNGQNVYPEDEVRRLIQICTVPNALTITSEFLENFGVISPEGIPGINKVVIESFSLPQSEGFRNVQLFQLKMLSDTPIQLTI